MFNRISDKRKGGKSENITASSWKTFTIKSQNPRRFWCHKTKDPAITVQPLCQCGTTSIILLLDQEAGVMSPERHHTHAEQVIEPQLRIFEVY